MRFDALEISLELIHSLKQPVARLRSRDPKLHQQIRSAASSIALNLAEGRRRCGKDRKHFWRIAAGSADEVRASLRVAVAWGDLDPRSLGNAFELLDRILAMLWKLTQP